MMERFIRLSRRIFKIINELRTELRTVRLWPFLGHSRIPGMNLVHANLILAHKQKDGAFNHRNPCPSSSTEKNLPHPLQPARVRRVRLGRPLRQHGALPPGAPGALQLPVGEAPEHAPRHRAVVPRRVGAPADATEWWDRVRRTPGGGTTANALASSVPGTGLAKNPGASQAFRKPTVEPPPRVRRERDVRREQGRDGWSLVDFMKYNGEDCVLLNSTKQTGQLAQKPVTVTGREEQQSGLLLDTSVGFKGGKFAAGLDVNAKRTYKVKIGGDVEEVDGSNIEYCILSFYKKTEQSGSTLRK